MNSNCMACGSKCINVLCSSCDIINRFKCLNIPSSNIQIISGMNLNSLSGLWSGLFELNGDIIIVVPFNSKSTAYNIISKIKANSKIKPYTRSEMDKKINIILNILNGDPNKL